MNTIKDKFIEYLNVEKRYSSKTLENYSIDLNTFITFCEEVKIYNYKDITYDNLRNYLEFLYNKNYSNKTISRHISSLKSFFKYLINNNYIKENHTELLSLPKSELRLPNYLNNIDLEDLINTPDKDTKAGKRDRLILEMFYSTGIRLSELVNIKISDIDFNNNMIKIKGKGNKDRYVFFGNNCSKYLKDYLENSRPFYIKSENEYLFVSQKGNKLSTSGVEYIVDKILKISDLKVHITPHVLRHTFATHMLNEGANLMTVKELLGHTSITTTGIYTHVSNEKLRKTYLSAHPRARRK